MPLTEHEEEKNQDAQRLLKEDLRFAAGRVAFSQLLIAGVVLFLLAGYWELQIQHQEYYSEAAERNRIKSLPVLAPRGKILDRDGRVIVDNAPSFSVLLSRESMKMEHVKPIAEGLNLDLAELEAKLQRFAKRPKYEPIMLKEELSPADIAFVESHLDPETFPEMEMVQAHTRMYPKDGLAGHVVGYVGEINEGELNNMEFSKNKPGDVVGKAGIEKQYNDLLTGTDGQRQVMVDNRGYERQVLGFVPATPGKSLQLTIDLDLQIVAELALEGRRGAVVALDPRNGEVLALASKPSYDSNSMSNRLSSKEWNDLLTDPDKPLFNRAIQAQWAPGSTFKPIVALAGLETGTIDSSFSATCGGGATFYGHYHACHLKGGHGTVVLNRAIAQSCDVYFYTVGNKLGVDNIAKYAEMAGLGAKTGIDLPYEASGNVPSTRWKMRTMRQKWYVGETISVAIGQGAVTVTPLQLAHAIGGMAIGGMWFKPHMLKEQQTSSRKADVKPENILKVVQGMHAVVNGGGTAGNAQLPGLDLCGKTGTAQLVSKELAKANLAKSKEDRKDYTDNAWFVGFASRDNPEIVVAALLENGGHGPTAAPIVRDVIKAYFDKKARTKPSEKVVSQAPAGVPGQ